MVTNILLALILVQLSVLAYGLKSLNDNLIHFGRGNNNDNTELVLLLRGIKSVAIEQLERN